MGSMKGKKNRETDKEIDVRNAQEVRRRKASADRADLYLIDTKTGISAQLAIDKRDSLPAEASHFGCRFLLMSCTCSHS